MAGPEKGGSAVLYEIAGMAGDLMELVNPNAIKDKKLLGEVRRTALYLRTRALVEGDRALACQKRDGVSQNDEVDEVE